MKSETIYLDSAATTPLEEEVLSAMLPWMTERFGNPSSRHRMGREARRALEEARERCAALLAAPPRGIVFTSGGTEANNLLIQGFAPLLAGRCVAATRLEHPSVAEPLKRLQRQGVPVHLLENDAQGYVDLDFLESLLARERLGLLCVIHGSNEVGTLQDAARIGRLVRERSPETWIHLDAVQSAGHVPLDPEAWGVGSLSVSSHKVHGPRGAGILAMYRDAPLTPLSEGGGQERGLRSGTENTAAVVGTAEALRLAMEALPWAPAHMAALRDRLAAGIRARIDDVLVPGDPARGLPHILAVSFAGLLGEVLLHHLEEKGVLVSTGSACHARSKEASASLKALRIPRRFLMGTVRFSFNRRNTTEEVDRALDAVAEQAAYLREVGT
jgi:cysteine desulfurase